MIQAHTNERSENEYVVSYLFLRRAIGILGMALPVVLFISYKLVNNTAHLPPSISHYFYTRLTFYFTGTLCAVALFLLSYRGPQNIDRAASLIAACCALGIVCFPTNIGKCPDFSFLFTLEDSCVRNTLHYIFAGLLFADFAYFSLFLFTKTGKHKTPTPRKKMRNTVYKICGYLILLSIIGVPLSSNEKFMQWLGISSHRIATFSCEAVALFAFGFSWLVKGDTVLKDKS